MNQDKHNERIEEYGRGFDLLMAALAEIPREVWAFKPAPDQWSVLDYQNQDVDDALEMFRLLQRTTYRLLKTLPDEAWACSIVHPEEKEPYTLEMWLAIYTEHVPEHCGQLSGVYRAWKAAGH
jgi:hypothetical protein